MTSRVAWVFFLGFIGCGGGSGKPAGELGGACLANGTCVAPLICQAAVCVTSDLDAGADAPRADARNIDAFVPDAFVPDAFGVDAPSDASGGPCDVLAQTGCGTGQKCTWIHDDNGEVGIPANGHIGCAAAGTIATGAACTYDPAPNGADHCITGDVCNTDASNNLVCQTICDNNGGGAPMCGSNQACVTFSGLFAAVGAVSTPAGVCEPGCNPLADNSFLGSAAPATKSGVACGSSLAVGCYGFPADGLGSPPPTHFICAAPAGGYSGTGETGTLVHRSPVPTNEQFLNSCAPGYNLSILFDAQGSMQIDCFAFCAPGNSFGPLGGANVGTPNGVAPHRCRTPDALGAFGATATPAGVNGEHCVFSWIFEVDPNTAALHLSETSDTVGICIDHTKYQFDSNGDGTMTTADATWPACPTLPLAAAGGSSDPLFAGEFGCVDHTKGASDGTSVPLSPSHAPARVLMERPRLVTGVRSAR